MDERTTRPCVFPGCRDEHGDPHITRDVICDRSRRHYRRLLDWLREDFQVLSTTMPAPIPSGIKTRSSSDRTYGHPAEWASDKMAEIAAALNQAEDDVRAHLGHAPGLLPSAPEHLRVARALRYLDGWFDDLCTYPMASETALRLHELHRGIRAALGHVRRAHRLDAPCPYCETLALYRDGGTIECHACGREPDRELYEKIVGDLVDDMLRDETVTESPEMAACGVSSG